MESPIPFILNNYIYLRSSICSQNETICRLYVLPDLHPHSTLILKAYLVIFKKLEKGIKSLGKHNRDLQTSL